VLHQGIVNLHSAADNEGVGVGKRGGQAVR
jgi:hypothetical protein